MNWFTVLETGVSVLLVVFALSAVLSRKLVSSIIFLSALSMAAVAGFALLSAPDVAVTEAVMGSGLVTFVFMVSIKNPGKAGDLI